MPTYIATYISEGRQHTSRFNAKSLVEAKAKAKWFGRNVSVSSLTGNPGKGKVIKSRTGWIKAKAVKISHGRLLIKR